jgi:putative membrane-bound dehydrogenase-like protein
MGSGGNGVVAGGDEDEEFCATGALSEQPESVHNPTLKMKAMIAPRIVHLDILVLDGNAEKTPRMSADIMAESIPQFQSTGFWSKVIRSNQTYRTGRSFSDAEGNRMRWGISVLTGALIVTCALPAVRQTAAQQPVIPHNQSKPPGPALSPRDAMKKMTVPPGFQVELVAAEPDLVNPVAMAFDEQGRIWVTESVEYPRSQAGEGMDRVKVLEDTDGDGVADRFTIFAEGLNIPSGIAVGHGGVWVANSPDLLFLKDTDNDGVADHREVVVTGFGRADTHELPNSLTWGPDGYLYGLNGVFNPSLVQQGERQFAFTCAMFRVHPRTREFQLFAEGTSNPWGIAWDLEGSAFISACVIDHLWHITESGYYHRQGGPYPPFTWKIGSIVEHTHQKAAYCGICYFDSDAYPEQYRERLYMGNIHGNCINADVLARRGSTYHADGDEDLLAANDVWFMPVAQKVGPDGCLYVLDWYDRYHCYQDARRDPAGIDRLNGRLYRIRYTNTPRPAARDLGALSAAQLVDELGHANIYVRETATRLLAERGDASTHGPLQILVLNAAAPRKARMHALWALISQGPLDTAFHRHLLEESDDGLQAWGVRAAGNQGRVADDLRDKIVSLAQGGSPTVQLQVAIAARKIEGIDAIPLFAQLLAACGEDPLIPQIVWQNLHPLLGDQGGRFVAEAKKYNVAETPGLKAVMPRVTERLLAAP